MELKLTKEQKRLKKDIVCFAREQLSDDTFSERDEQRQFSRELWKKCGENHIQGLHIPETHGGQEYNAEKLAIALQGLAYGCEDSGLLLALTAHMFGGQVPLLHHGTDAQKQKYLKKLSDGSWIAASAMTEPDGGSDLKSLTTTATPSDNGYTIQGEKTLILNAPEADVFIVYALTDPESDFDKSITCFVIDKNTAGLEVKPAGKTVGLRTAPMGFLSLNDVPVSNDQVVGGLGNGAAVYRNALAWERTMLAAIQVGRMEHLLESSLKHARSRQSGGEPIGKNQSISHKITDMKMRHEVARLLSLKAAWQLDQGDEAGMNASISKLFASESMVQSSLDAVQIFGGYGFLEEQGIGRSMRDALGGTLYAGTSAIQRNEIAKSLGLI